MTLYFPMKIRTTRPPSNGISFKGTGRIVCYNPPINSRFLFTIQYSPEAGVRCTFRREDGYELVFENRDSNQKTNTGEVFFMRCFTELLSSAYYRAFVEGDVDGVMGLTEKPPTMELGQKYADLVPEIIFACTCMPNRPS